MFVGKLGDYKSAHLRKHRGLFVGKSGDDKGPNMLKYRGLFVVGKLGDDSEFKNWGFERKSNNITCSNNKSLSPF